MGGSVNVESELGKGTKFILNLKTKCTAKKAQFKSSFSFSSGNRIFRSFSEDE